MSVSTPNSNHNSLQARFPNQYATLTQNLPLQQTPKNTEKSIKTIDDVYIHQAAVKDGQLATLSDDMKWDGSLLIATLATLGLKQRVLGVHEYMGVMSWFAAMAATPHIVNKMVRWKTGVDLNQEYDSTYGQHQNLYQDPHYLPLYLLPDKTLSRAADKLHVPYGPDRRERTEDKIRQVSVQAHTWWMLVAGAATPVMGGLLCDLLQDHALRQANRVLKLKDRWLADRNKTEYDSTKRIHRAKNYINRLVGEKPEADLSRWWKQFGDELTRKLALHRALSIEDVLKSPHADLVDKIAAYLGSSGKLSLKYHVKPALAYLDAQFAVMETPTGQLQRVGRLEDLKQQANRFLEEMARHIPDGADGSEAKALKQLSQYVDDRIQNAESTVTHYRDLLKLVSHSLKTNQDMTPWVKSRMRDVNFQVFDDLMTQGRHLEAQKLVGSENPQVFIRLQQQGQAAASLMGASPESHLVETMKRIKAGNLWRQRMGLYLGGGLILASALYDALFVGKTFVKPLPPAEEEL